MKSKVLMLYLLIPTIWVHSQTSLDGITMDYGNYKVGFRHYVTNDHTRTYRRLYDWNNKKITRPIPLSLWYPSTDSSNVSDPLTVLDYMEIFKEEEEWEYLPNEQILNWFYYPNTLENR
jgi:hypothetical protein